MNAQYPTARYLKPFTHACHICRERRAVCELMDRWNGSLGFVCRTCGVEAIKAAKIERDQR